MAAEPSTTTAVGSLLNGNYLLERIIAEGGMGIVYEAMHLRLPRKFAVKVLLKPKQSDNEAAIALQRFRREAEIASTLAHPHIVEVFDFQVSEGGSPYLVMELLDGEDLADRLKGGGRMPATAALRVIDEIAQALDVAHTAGVVHRDLKPANIFLSKRAGRDDFVKVLDFGVSKLIDSATLTQEKAMVGTPLYMSPEQAVGTQELTPESDVFSLGAIAYEILTGRRAFAASSIPSILYQIVHGPTPTLTGRGPGLGPEVDEVFARVLAKKKKDRFARATEFSAALRRVLERPERGAAVEAGWAAGAMPLVDDGSRPISVGTGAVQTEVDSSTRAEESLPEAARSGAAAPAAGEAGLSSGEAGLSSSALIVPRRRIPLVGVMVVMALAAAAGAVAVVKWRDSPVTPPMVALVKPAPVVASAPVVTPLSPAPVAPAPVFEPVVVETPPEPVAPTPLKKSEIQFAFHVVPRSAVITVDDKRVADQLTLPAGKRPHRVRVVAPGYRPLVMSVPATSSRNFELHLERVRSAPPPPHAVTRPARPVHDAAPVQDL